jgi:serine/threonine protein kinase
MQLGPYRIEALIGAGGMGQVFRARDTRLERIVAIKVLPAGAIADESRRKRLLKEARAASALSHPNIVTLHDISADGGIDFLVMEYVSGRSLQAMVRPEGLPLVDVLSWGTEVAGALAAAHSAGIVHRDIKPANIMITGAETGKPGQAKVLDFGVAAKLNQRPEETQAETVTQLTSPGSLIGTVAYMSPEQTRGEEVDERSDIFSLGVVLYQALTGRLPFQGANALALMHEIATVEPRKASAVNRRVPPALDDILSRALAKDRRERFQSAGELAEQLRKLSAAKGARRKGPRLAAYVYAAITAAGFAGWWAWQRQPAPAAMMPAPQQITNFAGGDGETGPSTASSPALSSDGKLLAFIHDSQVWVKLLPSGEPTQLTRDRSAKFDPAFSPDNARIAYSTISANGSWDTWVVPALGGEPRLWLPNASGLSWTGPDTILFSEIKAGIHMAVVSAAESRTRSRDVYVPSEIRGMAHRSYFSPDRKHILIAEMDRGGWLPCRVIPSDGSSHGNTVGPARGQCTQAAWSPDGRWIYLDTNASGEPQIWRQRFPGGAPEQLTSGPSMAQGIAVAPDGKSLITGIGYVQHSIVFHDENGEHTVTTQGDSIFPAWGDGFPTSVFSPDGSKLYYLLHSGVTRAFGGGEIWVHDFASGSNQSLVPGMLAGSFDVSTDGGDLVFSVLEKDSVSRLWVTRSDRRLPPRRIFSGEALGPIYGKGGEIYFRGIEGSQYFIFALNPDSGVARKLITDPAVDAPVVTPDRNWVVITVPVEGRDSTNLVKAFPVGGGEPVIVCRRCFIKWTGDRKALFLAFFAANSPGMGETLVIPLPKDQVFPKLPAGGLTIENGRTLPGARTISFSGVFPGLHPPQYVYANAAAHRNLYRLTFPQ